MQNKESLASMKYKRKRRRSAAPVFGLWLFLLFCCFMAAYFFLNSAFFAVKEYQIQGNTVLTGEEIIQMGELSLGTNIFKLQTQAAIERIEMHPSIKKAEIKRLLPSTVAVRVLERVPLALVVGQDGFIAVDEDGVYIKKISELKDQKIPLISQVKVDENIRPGEHLESNGLKAALQLIKLLKKEFFVNIAEILAPSQFSLTLKTVQGVEVRFGEPVDLERKIVIMEELLLENEAIINNQTVEYIDLRYQTAPVIKRKT